MPPLPSAAAAAGAAGEAPGRPGGGAVQDHLPRVQGHVARADEQVRGAAVRQGAGHVPALHEPADAVRRARTHVLGRGHVGGPGSWVLDPGALAATGTSN